MFVHADDYDREDETDGENMSVSSFSGMDLDVSFVQHGRLFEEPFSLVFSRVQSEEEQDEQGLSM